MVVAPLAILAHIVAGSLVIIDAPSSNNPALTIPLYQTAPTGRTWLELHNAGEHHLSVKGLSFRHMRSEAGRQTIDFS